MEYIGEHLWPGRIGHFLLILSFVTSAVALAAYWLSVNRKSEREMWLRTGRLAFRLHSGAVMGVIATLFYMISSHLFEYDYVWRHSSLDLPMRYIFSCFWEGQEGSFLLWIFWHMVLGNILIWKSKNWEGPVLAVFAGVQAVLGTMLLGIYFGDFQFGSNPFVLIRDMSENIGLPWTKNANYLTEFPQFADGRGLNPLLQNYWMTIHPPTLFLGFASVLVPFAYALAGLWTRSLHEWIRPALPWALFGIGVLGTGVLMGGAWAYEALSFGGFWAWDPVENSSLVPWITLVAGTHLMLINRQKQTSLWATLLMVMVSFILILYSTFLTRSGVLGDTSVHSFVESGILPQLLVFLLLAPAITVGLFLPAGKQRHIYWAVHGLLFLTGAGLTIAGKGDKVAIILLLMLSAEAVWLVKSGRNLFKSDGEEEDILSREFWVFVGSLVLGLAALQIIIWTSIPVFNKLLVPFQDFFAGLAGESKEGLWARLAEAKLAPPTNAIAEYNKWQVPFAVVITLLVGVGQFFKYKKTIGRDLFFELMVNLSISGLAAAVIALATGFGEVSFPVIALLFSCLFAVVANIRYLVKVLRGKVAKAGASIAHIGFGLLILGATISTSQSIEISQNTSIYDVRSLSEEFNNQSDIVLFQDDTLRMGNHFVSFRGTEREDHLLFFRVEYLKAMPKSYSKNEAVMHRGVLMRARHPHVAGTAPEPEDWSIISELELEPGEPVKSWDNATPGESDFILKPSIQLNKIMGNSPEPDTRHYWYKDLYTHVVWGRTEEPEVDQNGYMKSITLEMKKGDSLMTIGAVVRLDSLTGETDRLRHGLGENDLAAKAVLHIEVGDSSFVAEPLFIIRDQSLVVPDVAVCEPAGLRFSIEKIDPNNGTVTLNYAEHIRNQRDFIVMKAIEFPMINVLWIGCVVMVTGIALSIVQRFRNPKV